VTFGESIGTCLKKYATFDGRAGRSEYWWFFLFSVLAQAAGHIISPALGGLVALGLLLPGLGVGVRRLHDIGRSGWWLLVGLIPLIGAFVLLYWFVQPSGAPNQYGGAAPAAS